MGLCYSLRPLLFGDPEDVPHAASEAPAEDARPGPVPAPTPASAPTRLGGGAAQTPLPRGAGESPACTRPKAAPKKERRRRPEQLRAEEREAEREARKVSRNIDRMLREQKRDLQQTHRLLLLA
ncbi:guanine nucleotide-binding protein G(olf) subunit alpha isoform X1 [Prionailurus iriomotensis]